MRIKTGRRVLVAEVREGGIFPSGKIIRLLGGKEEAWRIAKWIIDKGISEGKVYIFEDELSDLIEKLKSYPIFLKRSFGNFLFRKKREKGYREFWEFYK